MQNQEHDYEGIIKYRGKLLDIDLKMPPKLFDGFYKKLKKEFEIVEMVDKTEKENRLTEIALQDTDRLLATMKANGHVFKP